MLNMLIGVNFTNWLFLPTQMLNNKNQEHIEFHRMSQVSRNKSPVLEPESKIHHLVCTIPCPPTKYKKSESSSLHSQHETNLEFHRKCSEHKISINSKNQISDYCNSAPASLGRLNSLDSFASCKNNTDIDKLLLEKDFLQRNLAHEIEYYIRLRMKDLITVQDLLLSNQYQRLLKYAETQLSVLRKRHEQFIGEDTCYKPTLTRDTIIKYNIEDDSAYSQLINNVISNLKETERDPNFVSSIFKKFQNEGQLSVRKLSWYFEHIPFDLPGPVCTSLATKFVNDLNLSNSHQIVELVSKSVNQFSNGKYNITIEQSIPKSQMSKLIEQHSITKVKSKSKF